MITYKTPLALLPLSGLDLIIHSWSDHEIECYSILGLPRQLRIGPYFAHFFEMCHWYSISMDYYEPDPDDLEWDKLQDPYLHDMLQKTSHCGWDDFNHIEVHCLDSSLSLPFIPEAWCPSSKFINPPLFQVLAIYIFPSQLCKIDNAMSILLKQLMSNDNWHTKVPNNKLVPICVK